jgi:hypothetical protein
MREYLQHILKIFSYGLIVIALLPDRRLPEFCKQKIITIEKTLMAIFFIFCQKCSIPLKKMRKKPFRLPDRSAFLCFASTIVGESGGYLANRAECGKKWREAI